MSLPGNSSLLWVTLDYALSLLEGNGERSLVLTLRGTLKILERHFSKLSL